MRILITGATGNVGSEVRRILAQRFPQVEAIAAVRGEARGPGFRTFDYDRPETFDGALAGVDVVFLLRPPHISKIRPVYEPLFRRMDALGVRRVVLLSVQGAPSSKVIPHRQIELLLEEFGFETVYARPSYFVQNLTTTLADDLGRGEIALPAAQAKFNWVDVADLAEACAEFLVNFERHRGRAYDLTGTQNLSFGEVMARLESSLGLRVRYRPVSLPWFLLTRLGRREPWAKALVMATLHFLPRVQGDPTIDGALEALLGRRPTTVEEVFRRDEDTYRRLVKPRS